MILLVALALLTNIRMMPFVCECMRVYLSTIKHCLSLPATTHRVTEPYDSLDFTEDWLTRVKDYKLMRNDRVLMVISPRIKQSSPADMLVNTITKQ